MNRNYEEIKSKVEKVMQESINSINDINFFNKDWQIWRMKNQMTQTVFLKSNICMVSKLIYS